MPPAPRLAFQYIVHLLAQAVHIISQFGVLQLVQQLTVDVAVHEGHLRQLSKGALLGHGFHSADNALLFLILKSVIVDVRKPVALRVDTAVREEHPVRVHGVYRDKVLGGAGPLKVILFTVPGFHLLFTW